MQTSLKTLKGLVRSLTVELPIDSFTQKVNNHLKKMAVSATISGFRKGKAPISLVRQRFGESANSKAINELVNETLADALSKTEITPATRPSVIKVEPSKNSFIYVVEFEVFAEIKVDDFSKLKIKIIKTTVTQDDEKQALNILKDRMTEFKPVKRNSKIGDKISIDFVGTIDGKTFAGGDSKDFKLQLGKGKMIPGFEDGLTNVASGKELTLNLKFPVDYHAKDLSGKPVSFKVLVNEVAAPKALKLDTQFAKKFGEKDINTLKEGIKKQMTMEAYERVKQTNKAALFDALLKNNDFAVPKATIDQEAQNLLKQMQERTKQQDEIPVSMFNNEAERRVKLSLLVNKISTDNELHANEDKIKNKIKEMAQTQGEDVQKMLDYYNQDPSRKNFIELMLVEDMVQDLILKKANVVVTNKKFKEITNRA